MQCGNPFDSETARFGRIFCMANKTQVSLSFFGAIKGTLSAFRLIRALSSFNSIIAVRGHSERHTGAYDDPGQERKLC